MSWYLKYYSRRINIISKRANEATNPINNWRESDEQLTSKATKSLSIFVPSWDQCSNNEEEVEELKQLLWRGNRERAEGKEREKKDVKSRRKIHRQVIPGNVGSLITEGKAFFHVKEREQCLDFLQYFSLKIFVKISWLSILAINP